MGTSGSKSCDQPPNAPNYNNPCTEGDHVGQLITIQGLCTDPENGVTECNRVGPEWTFISSSPCPCTGDKIGCRRQFFQGDKRSCCIKNWDETRFISDCYSDPGMKQTCDPNYRGGSENGCRSLFKSVCSDPTPDKYYDVWSSGDDFCGTMIRDNLLTPEGLSWAQTSMNSVIQKWFTSTEGIQPISRAEPFQDYLYNFCSENPSACDIGLSNVCSGYSREGASGNSKIADFCGCHMIPSVYALYSNQYAIGKECDPLCARTTTIPFTNQNGIIQECTSNICIIDDVTLHLTNSSVGNINFYQACGGCSGSASCQCTISGLSLETVEAGLGDINLEQYCQGSLTCYRQDPNNPGGPAIPVDCSEPDDYIPPSETKPSKPLNTLIIVIISIVIGIIVILGIILLIVVTRPGPPPVIQMETSGEIIYDQTKSKV